MRYATILPRASLAAVPVVASPDGTWIELAAITSHKVPRLEDALPYIMGHDSLLRDRVAQWKGPRYRQSEFEFLPPVVRPAAFRNFDAFEGHVSHLRHLLGLGMPEAWYEEPSFHFANRLSLVGHDARIWTPAESRELDFGLALGIIVGRRGRDIPIEKAWDHVAGFTVVNDFCARDLERRALPAGLGPSKGRDFATAVGPWMVPLSAVADKMEGERLSLKMGASLNGKTLVEASTGALYHSVPRLVSFASRDAELFPGDLLSTGASTGGSLCESGTNGQVDWLKPGDCISLEIEGIGRLATHIIGRPVL